MHAACFRVEFQFQDKISAGVCGFCRPGRERAVEAAFSRLFRQAFGPLREGFLADRRFARLLAQAGREEADAILLTAGSVRLPDPDAPCGAVLGDLFAPPQSAQSAPDPAVFLGGEKLSLLLQPGVGAAAFWPEDPELLRQTAAEFPAGSALRRLRAQTEGGLWALDYFPGSPLLDGSCQVYCKNQVKDMKGR